MTRGGAGSALTPSLTRLELSELDHGDNLLQTEFWGRFKGEAGWRPAAFAWQCPGLQALLTLCPAAEGPPPENQAAPAPSPQGRFLLLERPLPGGPSIAYIPYGPALPAGLPPRAVTQFLAALAAALRNELPPSCFMIRFDLIEPSAPPPADRTPGRPLRPAPVRIQPPDSIILNLAPPPETLLAGMHKKTRYNIRLAERKGVRIRRFSPPQAAEHLGEWYRLYTETARRDRIALHTETYYRRLFEHAARIEARGTPPRSAPPVRLNLYMAEHHGTPLAGIITARSGGRCHYLYGASGSLKRELMPNHLLQWRAITDAQAEGAREYDFFGIPPGESPEHPMHGLRRFKIGFGGNIVHYLGAWDYPFSPLLYTLYTRAERFRARRAARRKKHR